tara:strand:- start:3218 stop:5338 length:2121 start_codon:yes stop_codon:yes gene_type:complete
MVADSGTESLSSPSSDRPDAVKIRDLRKDYIVGGEPLHVLKGIDLIVPEGDYVAIMGPSGSGKSTLLNLLGCLDQATSGEFLLGGEEVSTLDDDRLAEIRAQNIGFVFQSYNLITTLTVEENIQAPLFYAGHITAEDRQRSVDLATKVGLANRLDHRPAQLSGGQQQRAGIARSLINNPRFILADEATGNLDSVTTEEILDLLDELNAEGKTIIMVTHEPEVAERARRIIRLRDGLVQSDERLKEIEADPQPPDVHEPPKLNTQDRLNTASKRFLRPWLLGIKSLYLHPMRSLLTVLGIFIGVASVIWLLAVGEGISAKAQEEIAKLGATNIIVTSVRPPRDPKNPYNRLYGVTKSEFEGLTETIPTIERAIPYRYYSRAHYQFMGRTESSPIKGVTTDYLKIHHMEETAGHFITAADYAQESKVVVLGKLLADKLFPYEDPIGKSVQVTTYDLSDFYRVVGVTRPSNLEDEDLEGEIDANMAFIPLSTYWRNVYDFYSRSENGEPTITSVTFQITDQDAVQQTADIIRQRLDTLHEKDDFDVLVPMDLLEQAQSSRIMFISMLGLVAAISLVVGGIGIMNIMLATVTERTREIGIRRALGAKQNDITRQFLVETIILSVVGGLVGIIAGFLAKPAIIGLRAFVQSSAPSLMEAAPESIQTMVPIVVPWSIPLAFGISVVVGVVFGIYPANRAAAMNPIEALRHVN